MATSPYIVERGGEKRRRQNVRWAPGRPFPRPRKNWGWVVAIRAAVDVPFFEPLPTRADRTKGSCMGQVPRPVSAQAPRAFPALPQGRSALRTHIPATTLNRVCLGVRDSSRFMLARPEQSAPRTPNLVRGRMEIHERRPYHSARGHASGRRLGNGEASIDATFPPTGPCGARSEDCHMGHPRPERVAIHDSREPRGPGSGFRALQAHRSDRRHRCGPASMPRGRP